MVKSIHQPDLFMSCNLLIETAISGIKKIKLDINSIPLKPRLSIKVIDKKH